MDNTKNRAAAGQMVFDRSTGTRSLPTLEQTLQAVELLHKTSEANHDIVIRLLRQGGFDVGQADAMPTRRVANPGHPTCIREFLKDVLPRATWKMIPFALAHDMYGGWLKKNHPDIRLCGKKRFIKLLWPLVNEFGWTIPGMDEKGCSQAIKPYHMMDGPEPLIVEYGCVKWYNPNYQGKDVNLLACPTIKTSYRCIRKIAF